MSTDAPLPLYSWEQAFCDAILETNNSTLAGRLENARLALVDRQAAINGHAMHRDELLAIQRALHGLQVLESERLTAPLPMFRDPSTLTRSQNCAGKRRLRKIQRG